MQHCQSKTRKLNLVIIPIRNLNASNDKSNFENCLGTATEARYEYRGTSFQINAKGPCREAVAFPPFPDTCCTSSVATLVATASSSPSRQRRSPQSLLALRLRFGIRFSFRQIINSGQRTTGVITQLSPAESSISIT